MCSVRGALTSIPTGCVRCRPTCRCPGSRTDAWCRPWTLRRGCGRTRRARRSGCSATSTAGRRRPHGSSPADDATAVTAVQLRGVVERLVAAGRPLIKGTLIRLVAEHLSKDRAAPAVWLWSSRPAPKTRTSTAPHRLTPARVRRTLPSRARPPRVGSPAQKSAGAARCSRLRQSAPGEGRFGGAVVDAARGGRIPARGQLAEPSRVLSGIQEPWSPALTRWGRWTVAMRSRPEASRTRSCEAFCLRSETTVRR